MKTLYIALLCLVCGMSAAQQIDPTFKPSASFSYGLVLDFEKQPDGKILVAGVFQTFDITFRPHLIRINSNGTIDPTFNTGAGFNSNVSDIQLQPDGKILVVGSFSSFNGVAMKNLVRLNPDGSRDDTFNTGGGFDVAPSKIALQVDGKILVTGAFESYNGTTRKHVARLNSNGSLDTSLDIGPSGVTNGVSYIIGVQADQKILIGGTFTTVNGMAKSGICRLSTNGTVDNTFIASGIGDYSNVLDIKILASGKILVAGGFDSFNGASKKNIVRLNANGSLDNSFLASVDGSVSQVVVMQDNSICLAGSFSKVNSVSTGSYAKLTENGVIDNSFQLTQLSSAQQIIIQDDKLVISGTTYTSDNFHLGLIRLNANGSRDASFSEKAIFRQAGGVTTAVQAQFGKIIVGGSILLPDGTEKNHFLRLHRDGTLDNSFNIGNGANSRIGQILILPDDKILAAGLFTNFGNQSAHRLIRLNAEGSIDSTFPPPQNDFASIRSLALQPDGKIIVSGVVSGSYNNTPIKSVFRLNSDGSIDPSFNIGNGPTSTGKALVQPDGKVIVFGSFTSWSGTPAGKIIRLLPNGSPDPTFTTGTGFDYDISTASLDADGKIVAGGYFSSYNGIPVPNIVRLNTNGTRDASFNPSFPGQYNYVNAIMIDNDNHILVGRSKYPYEENYPTYLQKLTPSGLADNTFLIDLNEGVESITMDIDGRIIIGGAFTSVNGMPRNGMFAILPPKPAPPSDVEAVLDSKTSIHITWEDASDSETGFIIERSLESPLSFTAIDTTLANALEYTDEDLEPGSTYIYRVASVNSAGPSDFMNSNPVYVENITGLEKDKTKSVQIWKNATGEYTVQTQWTTGFHLAVYDLIGRPVYSTESKSDEIKFYPGISRHGIYIFKIVFRGEVFTKKVADF